MTTSDLAQTDLAREAKAIVALAFRNGPIEDLHAADAVRPRGVSRVSDDEMKSIMKSAVNCVYRLLRLKALDPDGYERQIAYGARCAASWDGPESLKD